MRQKMKFDMRLFFCSALSACLLVFFSSILPMFFYSMEMCSVGDDAIAVTFYMLVYCFFLSLFSSALALLVAGRNALLTIITTQVIAVIIYESRPLFELFSRVFEWM